MNTTYQQYLVAWAAKESKSRRNDWPGFPLSKMPLSAKGDLHACVERGELRIVSEQRNGKRVSYVVPDA